MNFAAPPPTPDTGQMHQHPHYASTMLALGVPVMGTPQGIAVIRRLMGLRVAWMPAPTVPPDPGQRLAPVTLISSRDAAMDAALRQTGAIPVLTPQCRARLDLSTSAEARRAALHGKWRNRLTKAEAEGLKLHNAPLPDDPHHWLLQAEAAQRRQRRYRALPAAFALNWPQTRLFTLRKRQTDLAAMLFLIHGSGATYHIGWVSDEGRRLSAHNLILWQAADWLARRGCTLLDLGPLDTHAEPGLARFKLGTGATPIPSGHSWLYTRATASLGRLIT